MIPRAIPRLVVLAIVLAAGVMATFAQTPKPKKVFMITDMEGVSGILDSDMQCLPYKSPRWEESHKLLTGEVNAAVDGLLLVARRTWWCGTAMIPASRSPCWTFTPRRACWPEWPSHPRSSWTHPTAPSSYRPACHGGRAERHSEPLLQFAGHSEYLGKW